MTRTLALAQATFRAAVRHRILYLLLVFAGVLIAASRVLAMLTVGEDVKIIKDIGLTAISAFGLLVTLFVGVRILYREVERRTILVTLAGPVARHEYLLGQYLGLAAAITVNTAAMSALLVGLLVWREAFAPELLLAIGMLWLELMLLTAAAVFFTTISSPMFASLFTFAGYLVGHLVWSLEPLAARAPDPVSRALLVAATWVLPDLEFGDIRPLAVHGLPIPPDRVLIAAVYEIGWIVLLLLLASAAFRRRDLV